MIDPSVSCWFPYGNVNTLFVFSGKMIVLNELLLQICKVHTFCFRWWALVFSYLSLTHTRTHTRRERERVTKWKSTHALSNTSVWFYAYSLVDVNGEIDFMLIWQYPLHTMHILLHFEPVSTWNHRPQKAVQWQVVLPQMDMVVDVVGTWVGVGHRLLQILLLWSLYLLSRTMSRRLCSTVRPADLLLLINKQFTFQFHGPWRMVNVVNTCCCYVWFAGSVCGGVDLGHTRVSYPIYLSRAFVIIMCLRVHWYLNHGFGIKNARVILIMRKPGLVLHFNT